jgi:hypothetical protein
LYLPPVFAGLFILAWSGAAAQTNPTSSPSLATASQSAAQTGVQVDGPTPSRTAASPATNATLPGSSSKVNPRVQLVLANADKLVDLAQQLKSEMDKTNQYMLSLNSIHRAQDVEKLAKELQKQLQQAKK